MGPGWSRRTTRLFCEGRPCRNPESLLHTGWKWRAGSGRSRQTVARGAGGNLEHQGATPAGLLQRQTHMKITVPSQPSILLDNDSYQ